MVRIACPESTRVACNAAIVRVWRRLRTRYRLTDDEILDALGPLIEVHGDLTPIERAIERVASSRPPR